jgi:hypothetical protein
VGGIVAPDHTARSDSNADATVRSDQTIGLQPARPTTSVHRGSSVRISLGSLYFLDLDHATLVFSLSL